ncbi:cytochrome P450 family protein [Rhizoctonia solani AG-3 Rhs1AP]|uniref:Cytochrome P450 family protein n=2 Tax=Rhizoctonia solani AG-3 TaxID=1086053 RepID=A0A074SMN1_9AGAM|nr:cytochrome P450 family protein [Rhizoctonia solani AG-3 Rhs1AP]KEP51282.1 cytochrome P450 family protein [Rhizoctonia solani 123E]
MDGRELLYLALSTIIFTLLLYNWRQSSRRTLVRPPTPTRLPLIGNLLSLPPGSEHVAYTKLGDQLKSDIVFLEMLGLNIIVLNSAEDATELLEKRAARFSDRISARALAHPDLFDWPNSVAFLPYNDIWRFQRRMLNGLLNLKAVPKFHNLQEHHARCLLQRLLELTHHPQQFEGVKKEIFYLLESTMASPMFKLAYGYDLQGKDDSFLREATLTLYNGFRAVMFANFYVNFIPALMYVPGWFPGAGWKRKLRAWRAQKDQAISAPYNWVKERVADGTAQSSVLGAILQDSSLYSGLSPDIRDNNLEQLGIMIHAGKQSSTALLNFVAAMTLYPNIQEKAQLELDTVLGPGTIPTISDRERLPYINNLILELFRWRPILPIAIPHVCYEDDVYKGYDILKGDIVAMGRDKSIYANPEEFNPDRFLDPNVPSAPVFGWGRRKCPGLHFGEASAFIVLTSILSMFKISKWVGRKFTQRSRILLTLLLCDLLILSSNQDLRDIASLCSRRFNIKT